MRGRVLTKALVLLTLFAIGAAIFLAWDDLEESWRLHRIGSEACAEHSLKVLCDAEANFMRSRRAGRLAFAYELRNLREAGLIPRALAAGERSGYRFGPIGTYNMVEATDPRWGFAYYAVPVEHGVTGRRTFIVNHTGSIFYSDSGGSVPPARWPDTTDDKSWILLSE